VTIAVGTRLGSYEITGSIGAGGMGEVYRAIDTKLGREVAIKTLPSALAKDPDRLARFEREAKLLATLNHANIAVIHGLDEHDGMQFLAMELVEGATLEERLKDGPLPVEDALPLALQIAEALEAAHDKGVVHRDLKPANIMVTGDGVVKVLDFGLAKAFSGDPNQATPANSPALSMAMTQAGLILGTAGYMSPEQASGQATDQRADIWAFGVVLYEMLTGLPLFAGESVPHILADVLRSEPDWNRLPKSLHPRLKLLLERCLEKKVRNRYHSVADVRVDIEDVLKDPDGPAVATAIVAPVRPIWRRALPVAAAVLITALAVGFGVGGGLGNGASSDDSAESTPAPVRRYATNLGDTLPIGNTGLLAHVALSPDGARLVYAARIDNRPTQLYLRELDQLEDRVIEGTEGAYHPFFSPDGEWIAFYSDETDAQLKKVAVRGGAPQTLANAPLSAGGSWVSDDSLVYSTNDPVGGRGLHRVQATGGVSELLLSSNDEEGYVTPEVLPGGEAVLFVARPGSGGTGNARDGSVAMLLPATGEVRMLIQGGYRPRYSPTGHIVFVRSGALWAVPFDVETLEKTGPEVPVVEGVQQAGFTGGAAYAFSRDGVLMYVPGRDTDAGAVRSLVSVDRGGRSEPLNTETGYFLHPRISPDGERLAFVALRAGNWDIWIHDLARGTSSRLTFTPSLDNRPVWTPDGARVAFSSSGEGGQALLIQAADGTGQAERLTDSNAARAPVAFSPDGGQLVYHQVSTTWDLHVMSLEGERTSRELVQTDFDESLAALSRDGRWLAYTSNESGREEVYVRPYPDADSGKWQISLDGGAEPRWGPQGRELFYRDGEAMFVVTVETEPSFAVGLPEVLFRGDYAEMGGTNRPSYDVTPDGQRFIMMRDGALSEETSDATPLIVIENWFEELERLAPPSQ